MSKNSPSVAAIDMSKFIQANPGACCVYLLVRWIEKGLVLGCQGESGGVDSSSVAYYHPSTHALYSSERKPIVRDNWY